MEQFTITSHRRRRSALTSPFGLETVRKITTRDLCGRRENGRLEALAVLESGHLPGIS